MTPSPNLTIRGLRVRAVDVPLARPLQTGGGLVSSAPLALIDLETKEGVTGSSYLFCVTPTALKPTAQLLQNLSEWLADKPLQPYPIERMLHERLAIHVHAPHLYVEADLDSWLGLLHHKRQGERLR